MLKILCARLAAVAHLLLAVQVLHLLVIISVWHWPPLVLLSLLPLIILCVALIYIPASVRIHIILGIRPCLASRLCIAVRPVPKARSCVIIVRKTAWVCLVVGAIEIIGPVKIICSVISCHYIIPETINIIRVIAGIHISVPRKIISIIPIGTGSVPYIRWAIN